MLNVAVSVSWTPSLATLSTPQRCKQIDNAVNIDQQRFSLRRIIKRVIALDGPIRCESLIQLRSATEQVLPESPRSKACLSARPYPRLDAAVRFAVQIQLHSIMIWRGRVKKRTDRIRELCR